MPNVIGLPAMDALALLENMGLKVRFKGAGVVRNQSIIKGEKVKRNQVVVLTI
jgi:cell division protein FtsI (penicillin-binding protein 3)